MSGVRLLVSDVDGTLVTPDKTVSPATIAAARRLHAAGIGLCLVSSRPPRGMAQVLAAVENVAPFAAFNGGAIRSAQAGVIEDHWLATAVVETTLEALASEGIEAWVFAGDDWLIADPNGAKVERERMTVGFDPIVTKNLRAPAAPVGKIVGVSDDHERLAAFGRRLTPKLTREANVGLSQPYYLDITPPAADKGRAVRHLAKLMGASLEATMVIGDMWNDVAMFEVAGSAIAMGQAPDGVKTRAAAVTGSNSEEGWAQAVEAIVLAQANARHDR